jgi:hypothetical protein
MQNLIRHNPSIRVKMGGYAGDPEENGLWIALEPRPGADDAKSIKTTVTAIELELEEMFPEGNGYMTVYYYTEMPSLPEHAVLLCSN